MKTGNVFSIPDKGIEKVFSSDLPHAKETVLLVTHGGVMNVILCLENGVPYTNKETRFSISDAGIICIP